VIPATFHLIRRCSQIWLAVLLLTSFLSLPANAAISEGPKPRTEEEAKKRLNLDYYQAKQSFEDQLRVGQERYKQKQLERAKIVATMTAEFQARQQVVTIQPPIGAEGSPAQPGKPLWPTLVIAALIMVFISCVVYLKRQRVLESDRE
jgi:hypothetical protein